MGWPARIILIRHGKSEINLRSRDENALNPTPDHSYPLVDKGRAQAKCVREFIAAEYPRVDVILSSHYVRALQTAEIVFPGREIVEDPRLAEMHIGVWRVLTDEQIRTHMPWEVERCRHEGMYNYRPPAGENGPDVEMRIRSLRHTLEEKYEGHVVALVTHHQWLVLFQRVNGEISIVEAEKGLLNGPFRNASVTVYEPSLVAGRNILVPRLVAHAPWVGKVL